MTPTILFILHLPPPVHGAAMMGKYVHDSELINSRFDCHYINLTTARSLQDIGKGGVRKLWKFLKLLRQIRREVKRLKPQLVYVTPNACGGAFYKDFVVVEMLKAMGCRVVVHYHNKGVATRQDRWLDDKLYDRFFRGLKVILLAEALYQDVKKYVHREDVLICPNGIPETIDHEPTAERHNRIPHLLFLSNLLVDKGVLVLLDALKILADKGYSFVCDFVGGETAEIDAARFKEEVERRGLNRLVVYDGKKYGKDKEAFFEKADAFVFPTSNEAFGLVSLEAMEHKLPVVATDEGGIPDVVKDGENGLIAEKRNAKSLADCVAQLLGNKELREKMGEDGYRKFKAHFTLQAFEAKLSDSLDDITQSGGVILDFVHYYGKKFGTDKLRFLEQADVFVSPSFNEAFPLVNLEAMQYALPVVATDVGGVTAEVKDGENGLIAETGNARSLADGLMQLMEHPELRRRMGEDGYRKFKAQFTLQAFEAKLSESLDDILQSGGVKCSLVCYYGKKYGRDKDAFFRHADVFVFPTYYHNECFPLVLLEAMEQGVPCISSREGGIAGIIDDEQTGWLVDQPSAEAVADKVEWMIRHRGECRYMGMKGRAKFLNEFTLAKFEERMAEVLDACVRQ